MSVRSTGLPLVLTKQNESETLGAIDSGVKSVLGMCFCFESATTSLHHSNPSQIAISIDWKDYSSQTGNIF